MSILVERPIHCFPHDFYTMRNHFNYYSTFCRNFLEEFDEPSAIDLKANLGKEIISDLPSKFKLENNGRYVAVTFTRKILAITDNLEALNKSLAKMDLKENYYIDRIGYDNIAQL